jgi:hypothetical protein
MPPLTADWGECIVTGMVLRTELTATSPFLKTIG